jgi:hypothetical protein
LQFVSGAAAAAAAWKRIFFVARHIEILTF